MEHPCPKCGTPVEDGTPFCRHCRAPQIRVAIEPTPEIPPRIEENHYSSEFIRPPTAFTPGTPHLPSAQVDWSHGLPCAAMGGFLALFLSIIPFFLFGPAFLAAGAFAVFLYRRRTLIRLNGRAGARLGAASGGFAFLFVSVVISASVFYAPDKVREAMATQLKAGLKTGHYDPEVVRTLTNFVNTNAGLAACVIFSLLIILLICVVGASIGGAWYSAWLQKRDRG